MVSKFYVYETVHGGESESTHYDELAEWGIEPDLVGIEADPKAAKSDGLVTRSPGTSLLLALKTRFMRLQVESRLLNRKDWFADLAAARRFAGERGVPVVDLDRRTHGEYVETLSPTRCVADTVLAFGAAAFVIFLFVTGGSVIPALPVGGMPETLLQALVGAVIGVLAILAAEAVILSGYSGWLLRTRPTEMVETATRVCADRDADTALLVVATVHTDEVRHRAEARGIEVEVRSSPAAREYDGGSPLRNRILQSYGPA
ncbi:hypothetical protein SAMN05216388_1001391 [Halorientalis persicus]|uniref:Uncharacterized protein n=1 Tax=Halorientalis persicus TaxID=1367881 RepID=A0A1H8DV17_9EURY|nr:hypothetical protein [Halorientalis persicus]SEN11015.1 hypothetical protein SAMN05216388_1001391 [Halorientalis persicus]